MGTLHDLRLAGHRHIHVSAVCPDGVWTPMLRDRVDDPHAAASWQGVLLQPEDVARVVVDVVARPRPVVSIPRRRGLVRLYAAFPRLVGPFLGLIMRRGRAEQAAFRRRHPGRRLGVRSADVVGGWDDPVSDLLGELDRIAVRGDLHLDHVLCRKVLEHPQEPVDVVQR